MEFLQTIAQFSSAALISSFWQGVVLATLVWLCLKLSPRISAGVRFNIWIATFAAIAILPVLSILGKTTASIASAASLAHPVASAVVLDPRWAIGISAFWAIFAAGRLLVLAINALNVRRLLKSSTPVEPTPGLQSILSQPGLRGATLCTSSAVDQPCVIGFFSPRILVPAWLFKAATPAELEQIVLHESAHLRRFDDWTNLAQKLAMACFPLNPALFLIERRLCAEREIACDESVVRITKAPREYATCLTHLAEQRLARRTLTLSGALSLGAWERRSQLAGRVESILLGKSSLGKAQTQALALSLILATIGGAIKLSSTAQIVSFASAAPTALAEETAQSVASGPHYQDVVFHPASYPAHLSVANPVHAKPAKRIVARRKAMASPLPNQSPAQQSVGGVKSVVIVTRWQSASGQQMTVIDQVVRISALSAAQSQGGWFVVQL